MTFKKIPRGHLIGYTIITIESILLAAIAVWAWFFTD